MPFLQHHSRLARGLIAGVFAGIALPAMAAPALLQTEPTEETATTPAVRRVEPPTELTNARLRSGVYPAQPVPPEFAIPPDNNPEALPLDWSVGLRGTYSNSNGDSQFVTRLTPQFTATHAGGLADLVVQGSAEIAKSNTQDGLTLTSGALSVSATAPLGLDTTATLDARLGLTQDLPGTAGLSPFVTTPPQVITGGLDLGIDRRFGKFNVGIGGGISRTNYGATTRTDTGLTDNSEQNYWSANTNLRLGYQITPILEVFGEAEYQRDMFDIETASLGAYPNASNRTLRAGLSGKWDSIWTASASVGVGERVFDEASIGSIRAYLYGAELSYTPDSTVKLTAGAETALAPAGADNPGNARIQYTAFANAQYTVNTWLRLRANAELSFSELVGSGTTERRLGLGAGADYALSAHTSLNADYGYGNTENTTNGNTQNHQVSLGITLSR